MSAGTNTSKLKRAQSASANEVPEQSEWDCRTHGCAANASQPERRKSGGQPGNTNAFKHGFYAKNFSLAERRGLQAAEGLVLVDEISLLRVLIRRFAEQVQANQDVSLNESVQHLAVVSEAMSRLANLLRTDHMLGGDQTSNFITQLNLALKNVAEEMGIDER